MKFRNATIQDAEPISLLLRELAAVGKRTSRSDIEFVREIYLSNPDGIQCTVAEGDSGDVLGFQALARAIEGNRFDVEPGWGIIGTHVSPHAFRQGVGKGLWLVSRKAAESASIRKIDAHIGADNAVGLAYYESIGFRTYRASTEVISKCFSFETNLN